MTKRLPGSVGPSHQPFRSPGVGRAFGERPGQVQMGVRGPLTAGYDRGGGQEQEPCGLLRTAQGRSGDRKE